MPPDPRVHVGVGAVVYPGWMVGLLMVKRGGTGHFAGDGYGTWSVPGGWLEMGEQPMEAAARETLEETGVVVEPVRELGWVCCSSATADIQIVTLFVLCVHVDGEATVTEPHKCPEVAWQPRERIEGGLPLFAPLQAALDKRMLP